VGIWVLEQELPLLQASVPRCYLLSPCRTLDVGLSLGCVKGKSLRPGGLELHHTGPRGEDRDFKHTGYLSMFLRWKRSKKS
jgi:hypothetical protein